MSVGLLIISHNRNGGDLLRTAQNMLGACPLQTANLAVSQTCDPAALLDEARRLRTLLNQGHGVLVLTDMYGSTPSNIARRLLDVPNVRVIAGINLPMLVRVLNYPSLDLAELTNKALSGGHDGIVLCEPEDP